MESQWLHQQTLIFKVVDYIWYVCGLVLFCYSPFLINTSEDLLMHRNVSELGAGLTVYIAFILILFCHDSVMLYSHCTTENS